MPGKSRIGPYSLNHKVRVIGVVDPSSPNTSMLNSRGVINTFSPSTRYVVGSDGSRFNVYAVKRLPADTVWVQAKVSVNPMPMPGTPVRFAP